MDNEFSEILDDEGLGKTREVEEENDTYYKWGSILAILSIGVSALPLLIGNIFEYLGFVMAFAGVILVLLSKEDIRSKLIVIVFLVLFWGGSMLMQSLL